MTQGFIDIHTVNAAPPVSVPCVVSQASRWSTVARDVATRAGAAPSQVLGSAVVVMVAWVLWQGPAQLDVAAVLERAVGAVSPYAHGPGVSITDTGVP